MGFSLTPSPHLSDKQDTFQEHVVLVVLIHGLLIDKVPGLQIRVVWEQQRAPGFRTRHSHRQSAASAQGSLHLPWSHSPTSAPSTLDLVGAINDKYVYVCVHVCVHCVPVCSSGTSSGFAFF